MCISNLSSKMYSWRQQSARLSFIPRLLRSSKCAFGIQIPDAPESTRTLLNSGNLTRYGRVRGRVKAQTYAHFVYFSTYVPPQISKNATFDKKHGKTPR